MRATSAASAVRSRAAASFKASQNGASSDIEVLWPRMSKERLTGRIAGQGPA
jgi:hypothetical protein